MRCGAEGQNRTADTGIFSPSLYQLSYLGATKSVLYFSGGLGKQNPQIFFPPPAAASRPHGHGCSSSPSLKFTRILKSLVAGRLRMGTPVLAVMASRRSCMYSLEGPMKVNQML